MVQNFIHASTTTIKPIFLKRYVWFRWYPEIQSVYRYLYFVFKDTKLRWIFKFLMNLQDFPLIKISLGLWDACIHKVYQFLLAYGLAH